MCPTVAVLTAYCRDQLAAEATAGVESHLEACPDCLRALQESEAREELAAWFPTGWTPTQPPALGPQEKRLIAALLDRPRPVPALGFLEPPEHDGDLGRLGRFRVREVLGEGGMGLVLGAIDPASAVRSR